MKITPKTEEEIKAMNLISPGIYEFEVFDAVDKISDAGNEMIMLKMLIIDENNRERWIYDNLLDAMAHKVRHFCEATGLLEKYNSELLVANDCIGKKAHLQIIIKKDKKGQYGDNNSVKDYIKSPEIKSSVTRPLPVSEKKNDFIDDDLPF